MRVPSFFVPATIILALQHSARAVRNEDIKFSPKSYPKQTATCKAINRAADKLVDLHLHYVEVNPAAETTLLMVHGWPSLWSTWSNQIQEFQDDYRLIVPDLRGFGSSTHPGDYQSSGTMGDMVADLVCILEHASVTSAICVGHDWGAQVCHSAARMRPDLFKAVAGLVLPYISSAGPFIPIAHLVPAFPNLAYNLYFEANTTEAAAELNKNITRSVRGVLRTVDSPPPASFLKSTDSFLAAWNDVEIIPPVPFFTAEEEDYFVEQYSIHGFQNTLQFYTFKNKYLSWEFANGQGNATIPQPALSILPLNDPVADWVGAARILHTADFMPNLKTVSLEGAHWLHLENPIKVNIALRAWLDGLSAEVKGSIAASRPGDEL